MLLSVVFLTDVRFRDDCVLYIQSLRKLDTATPMIFTGTWRRHVFRHQLQRSLVRPVVASQREELLKQVQTIACTTMHRVEPYSWFQLFEVCIYLYSVADRLRRGKGSMLS